MGLSLSVGLPNQGTILVMCGAAVGSLLPDIDRPGSKISRSSASAGIISFMASLGGHRKFFHTKEFILILMALAYALLPSLSLSLRGSVQLFLLGFFPGMLSHLILDTLNPGGIMWLWPFSKRHYSLGLIITGSIAEFLLACCLVAVLALLVNLYA